MAEVQQQNYVAAKENENVFSVITYPSGTNANGTESVENLIQVNSRASMFKKKHFYKKLSTVLFIILLILFIGLIVLAICYENLQRRNKLLCTTDECLRTAANFKYSMNLNVNPCDDFYEYTCGHWTEEHPNHGWYPKFSSFSTIGERVAINVLNFLKTNATEMEPVPVQQTRDFYKSCMDQDAKDKLGYTVIYKYLKQVKLPIVPNFFNKSLTNDFKFDWLSTEVLINKIFGMDTFLHLVVDASIYQRNSNVIYMGMPAAGSPLPTPLKLKKKLQKLHNEKDDDNDFDDDLREEIYDTAYKNIIRESIKVVIDNHTKLPDTDYLDDAVENIMNVTADLLQLLNDTDDYNFNWLTLSVGEIQNYTNQYLINNGVKPYNIWENYITKMFDDISNITISFKNDLIYIRQIELDYLGDLLLYLNQLPHKVIELYMWWSVVDSMIINTTTDIILYISMQYISIARDDEDVTRPKSLTCAELVTDFMGLAVSYGIADRMFLNNTRPKVEHMLNDIKQAFTRRVNTISWMDKETKKVTLEKSKEMLSFIGFPEWLLDRRALEVHYGNLTIECDTYLENMMQIVKTIVPSRLETLRNVSERTWSTDPIIVNAYNSFSDNAINVPMAILAFPVYHLGLESLNYGSLGTILGHELTHGFDNTGRKFDKYGNYRQWWTNRTIETFEKNTECFVKQYDNYTIPNVNENIQGKTTLGENLADNGGLNHAFSAYINYVDNNRQEPKLPGFESFTHTQLFFIAFGSIWCESSTDNQYKEQILTDEHCPNKIRVIGTLQNSYEFSKAFKCPKGSYMNPNRERCRIW